MFELEELASRIRKTAPEARNLLLADKIDEFKRHPVYKEVEAYLRRHFFHCENDEDILSVRWIDDPSVVLAMLKMLLESTEKLPPASKKDGSESCGQEAHWF